jgi:hypothetical protein
MPDELIVCYIPSKEWFKMIYSREKLLSDTDQRFEMFTRATRIETAMQDIQSREETILK